MSKFDYSAIRDLADALLEQFGHGRATIIRRVGGAQDAVLGTVGDGIITQYEASLVSTPTDVGITQRFDHVLEEGDWAIGANVKHFIVSAKNALFRPEPNDLIFWGEVLWCIKGVTIIEPAAGVAVIFKIGAIRSG